MNRSDRNIHDLIGNIDRSKHTFNNVHKDNDNNLIYGSSQDKISDDSYMRLFNDSPGGESQMDHDNNTSTTNIQNPVIDFSRYTTPLYQNNKQGQQQRKNTRKSSNPIITTTTVTQSKGANDDQEDDKSSIIYNKPLFEVYRDQYQQHLDKLSELYEAEQSSNEEEDDDENSDEEKENDEEEEEGYDIMNSINDESETLDNDYTPEIQDIIGTKPTDMSISSQGVDSIDNLLRIISIDKQPSDNNEYDNSLSIDKEKKDKRKESLSSRSFSQSIDNKKKRKREDLEEKDNHLILPDIKKEIVKHNNNNDKIKQKKKKKRKKTEEEDKKHHNVTSIKEECFLCAYGNSFHDGIMIPHIDRLFKIVEEFQGIIDTESLAKMIYLYYKEEIYNNKEYKGQYEKLPMHVIIEHLTQPHSLNAKNFIINSIRDFLQIRFLVKDKLCKNDGTLDLKYYTILEKVQTRLERLYHTDPKKMNFNHGASATDLNNMGPIFNMMQLFPQRLEKIEREKMKKKTKAVISSRNSLSI